MHRSSLLLLLAIFLVSAQNAHSQNNAFKQLSVGAYFSQSVSDNDLSERWDPGLSLQLNFQTPFYAGLLDGGIRYTRFNNLSEFPSYSDFHTAFVYLGWGYLFDIAGNFRAGPVLRFGNIFFLYDDAKIYPSPNNSWAYNFDTTESEFAYELLLQSEYQLSKNWKLIAELDYNRTLTFHPIRQTLLTIGFSYSFDSPTWFQKIFK